VSLEAAGCRISGKLSADDLQDTAKMKTVGAGIAIGTAIGAGIGVAMGNLGAGIAIGIAIGAAVGASRQRKGQ
jgi:F0F1-type ATP synthase membrane subunit c/vacuolar-type H+-ATPase subunit K